MNRSNERISYGLSEQTGDSIVAGRRGASSLTHTGDFVILHHHFAYHYFDT
ncbi:hypothetical protein ACFLZM_03990 [Thermodesulfobacteriota bacterium]